MQRAYYVAYQLVQLPINYCQPMAMAQKIHLASDGAFTPVAVAHLFDLIYHSLGDGIFKKKKRKTCSASL